MKYVAPAVKVLGSVEELTQVINKNYAPVNDGITFQGKNVNVS